jgi:hypothetical protein
MSRSGYHYYHDNEWQFICWRGAVKSAIRGKRGQMFLREMLASLDALPEKRLIDDDLIIDGKNGGFILGGDSLTDERGRIYRVGDVCALGAVGRTRGLNMDGLDPHDPYQVAPAFGIARALAQEIVFINDEGSIGLETPEQRFGRVRAWIIQNLRDQA